MVTSFKRCHALRAPNPAAGHCRPTPLPETPGHSQASLCQSLVGSLLLSPGSCCTQGLFVPSKSVSPVLCKFWQLYGGIDGHLLQEGLCHTQVYCIQRLCPCSSPLLIRTSQETPKHSSVLVSVESLGPGAHKVYLSQTSWTVKSSGP